MEKKEILKKLDVIVATAISHHNFVLDNNTKPADVQGWDSLANAMIITAVQNEFGIKLKFVELVSWKTIGQLVDIIENKLS